MASRQSYLKLVRASAGELPAVFTHVNKSRPGRKIRAAQAWAAAHKETDKAREAVVRFLGRGEGEWS
jgi:hypothetical protein